MRLSAFYFLRSFIFDVENVIIYKMINIIVFYSFKTS